MDEVASSRLERPLLLPSVPPLAVLAGCAVVLLGWLTSIGALTSLAPGLVPVKVNTAVCLTALALGLLARPRALQIGAAGIALTLSAITLAQYAVGRDFGIDELVLSDAFYAGVGQPGRMALSTALCMVLLAVASLTRLRPRWGRLTRGAVALASAMSTLSLVGYVYGATSLFGVGTFGVMAPAVTVATLVLANSIALTVPGSFMEWMVKARSPSATMMRWMLPLTILTFPAIGALIMTGQLRGWYGARSEMTLIVGVFGALILSTALVLARTLDRVDESRRGALERLRAANEELKAHHDSERARAEKLSRSLTQQREMFARAVGAFDDLIYTLRWHEDGTATTEFSNANFMGLFGQQLDQPERSLEAILEAAHPEDRHLLLEFFERASRGEAAEVEGRLIGADGRTRWVWSRGTGRRVGDRLYFDGIATEVTERHELAAKQQDLLAREQEHVQRLQQLNHMREEFLAVSGHELKTPLAAIQGFASLLSDDDGLDTIQRHQAEVIARRAAQMSEMVNNFFDLTTMESGMTVLKCRPMPAADFVDEVVQGHHPDAAEAGLRIETRLVEATIEIDPGRFRQVVDNLLSNAVKYSTPGGRILVETQLVEPAPGECRWQLRVLDQGIGIPEDEQARVFDRMFRASTATSSGVSGTGLGLAVTRGLVLEHGGEIGVAAHPDGGTVFTVTLPCTPAPAREH